MLEGNQVINDGYQEMVANLQIRLQAKDQMKKHLNFGIEPPKKPLSVYNRYYIERYDFYRRREFSQKQIQDSIKIDWQKSSEETKNQYQEAYQNDLKQYEQLRDQYLYLTKPPKRPLSAYFIFYQEQVNLVGKKENLLELCKKVGQQWKEMSEIKKKPYQEQVKTMKEEYMAKMEQYKNQDANDSAFQNYRQNLKKYEEMKKMVVKSYRNEERQLKYLEKAVDTIVGIRTIKGVKQYLVKWINTDIQTWETKDKLRGCEDLINQIEEQYFRKNDELEEEEDLDESFEDKKQLPEIRRVPELQVEQPSPQNVITAPMEIEKKDFLNLNENKVEKKRGRKKKVLEEILKEPPKKIQRMQREKKQKTDVQPKYIPTISEKRKSQKKLIISEQKVPQIRKKIEKKPVSKRVSKIVTKYSKKKTINKKNK